MALRHCHGARHRRYCGVDPAIGDAEPSRLRLPSGGLLVLSSSRTPTPNFTPLAASSSPAASGRLIIVSNRLPVTVATQEGLPVVKRSVGGLASGLRGPHERAGSVWIGWPGDLDTLEPRVRDEVARQLSTMRIVPLTLSAEEVRVYYDRLCNSVLWPICHDRLDQLPLRVRGWDAYEAV